jgi:hypothetical protein
MKNDLSKFEKDLLKSINFMNNTSYTHKNFMEWGTDYQLLKKNKLKGERIYKTLGCFVAIKENI